MRSLIAVALVLVVAGVLEDGGCRGMNSAHALGLGGRYRYRLVAGSILEREGRPREALRGGFVAAAVATPNRLFDLTIERLVIEATSLSVNARSGRVSSYTSFPRVTFVMPNADLDGTPASLVGGGAASTFLDGGPRRGVPVEFRGITFELPDGGRMVIFARRAADEGTSAHGASGAGVEIPSP